MASSRGLRPTMALVPLVLLSLACSDDAPVVLAPHGSASLILIELTDTDLVANAYSIVAGEALSPPLRAGTRVLFALQYDAPLAALQLSEGELHVDPSGGALPPADRTFQLRAERLDDGWLGLSDAPPGLAELRFRERRACLQFQSHQRTLPGLPNEGVLLLSEATPDAVLLGTGQRYFEIKQGSERLLTTISTSAPYYEAFLAPDRDLWLLSSGGRFAHGDLDRGFVPGPQAPPGNWIDVDGARAGAPFELYALDNTLSVARFTPAEG